MPGIQNPRTRPHRYPGQRSTFGPLQPMLPSRSFGSQSGQWAGESQPTKWTPWGAFAPGSRPYRPLPYGMVVDVAARHPGAYYTPPATWNLTSMADGFIYPVLPRGRNRTPIVPRVALNPFPAFQPPLPSYPAPASWPGRL